MLSESQQRRLSEWSNARGGMALLIGRLIPLIAFNLLNYAAALTDISWWTFIWATGLGILPLTIVLNIFGDSMLTMRVRLGSGCCWAQPSLWSGCSLGVDWQPPRRTNRRTKSLFQNEGISPEGTSFGASPLILS